MSNTTPAELAAQLENLVKEYSEAKDGVCIGLHPCPESFKSAVDALNQHEEARLDLCKFMVYNGPQIIAALNPQPVAISREKPPQLGTSNVSENVWSFIYCPSTREWSLPTVNRWRFDDERWEIKRDHTHYVHIPVWAPPEEDADGQET